MHHRGCFGGAKPLSLAAIDAAIEATIGKAPRRDRLARDDRVYRWVVRRCITEGGMHFRTTYAEAARGAGYNVPRLKGRAARREARHRRVSTIYRALNSLRAAGLVEFQGVKRRNGQWRCLEVRLLPAGRRGWHPPAGESQRRPRRCRLTRRILFSRGSGTSPAVVPRTNSPSNRVGLARARARAPGGGSEGARAGPAPATRTNEDRYAPWRETDAELVELCELFERCYGRSARFSFRRHGPILGRALARIDRYWRGGTPGAGVDEARALIEASAAFDMAVNSPSNPQSLAYFVPIIDEISKDRRRWWRRRNPRKPKSKGSAP